MYYEKIYRALNRHRIRYLVIGGVAVNLYGLHRMTRDLDLMIDISENNLEKFIKVIEKLGYQTNIAKSQWNKLNAVAFKSKDDEFDRIDIFLRNPLDFDSAYKRRKVFKAGNISISCISLEDLLKLKSKADRVRDWIDVGSLKRIVELRKRRK